MANRTRASGTVHVGSCGAGSRRTAGSGSARHQAQGCMGSKSGNAAVVGGEHGVLGSMSLSVSCVLCPATRLRGSSKLCQAHAAHDTRCSPGRCCAAMARIDRTWAYMCASDLSCPPPPPQIRVARLDMQAERGCSRCRGHDRHILHTRWRRRQRPPTTTARPTHRRSATILPSWPGGRAPAGLFFCSVLWASHASWVPFGSCQGTCGPTLRPVEPSAASACIIVVSVKRRILGEG